MEKVGFQRWLNTKQAAEYLGMTERALYNKVHRREIPFCRLRKRLRFDRLELDRMLTNSTI